MTTIGEALAGAASRIAAALGLDAASAHVEARSLLSHALGVDAAWLVAHGRDVLDGAAFEPLVERRLRGEPVSYIMGSREFFGLDLRVSPAVLIPRPETETLVEQALARMPPGVALAVVDLGTGSGAVAIAIRAHRPPARVTAVDASAEALAVARENAARVAGASGIRFLEGDWFAPLRGERFDLIVSNPPYVAEGDRHLARGDLRFEPRAALAAGEDGMRCIRALIEGAPGHLAEGGWLLFEHGHDQAQDCRNLLARAGFKEVDTVRDLSGLDRVTLGRFG